MDMLRIGLQEMIRPRKDGRAADNSKYPLAVRAYGRYGFPGAQVYINTRSISIFNDLPDRAAIHTA